MAEAGLPVPSDEASLARVRTLAPAGAGPLRDFLEGAEASSARPFSEERLGDLDALSQAILKDAALRQDPATVAAGYWLRRSQSQRLREAFLATCARCPDEVRVPAGRVFHVTPGNVDTLFLYTWALAYLCGNTSLVRLSGRQRPEVKRLLEVFSELASGRRALAMANRFVTYEHDPSISGIFSAWCSQRVLWGGDETVQALRAVPLNPHAGERAFASKFSCAALRAAAVLALDEAGLARLASDLFNDLFWFDQMACSSPQILFWAGREAEAGEGARRLHAALQAEVERRAHAVDLPQASRRLAFAFGLALRRDVRVDLGHSGFVAVELREPAALEREICGGGLVRHSRLESLQSLLPFIRETEQTLTHFGFGADELRAFAVEAGARGLDRLVPIGQALAFRPVWDGCDLVEDFTRRVSVVV